MTQIPLLLLDVDGVLNAVCRPDRFPKTWDDWNRDFATANGASWPITYSARMVNALQELHAGGAVEIRWLTTWAHHANGELRDLLGFPEPFEVVASPHDWFANYHGWWKFDAVQKLELTGRPLIWLDDDLGYDRLASAWVEERVEPTLGISPHTSEALTPHHVQLIRDFAV